MGSVITQDGMVVKAISGFYQVKTKDGACLCKPRGLFRKQEKSPVVGDRVTIIPDENEGVITHIHPRKNEWLRPPIANLDQLFLILSTCKPKVNYLVVDTLLAIAVYKDIMPTIIFTKTDLQQPDEALDIYSNAGVDCMVIDYQNFIPSLLLSRFQRKVSAFCGNTGVGKSTLLNHLFPDLQLPIGETSEKLGRGRHTTRHVELFEKSGGLIADTPGFSTVVLSQYMELFPEELANCFIEFRAFSNQCRFLDCAHLQDAGCAVTQAVKEGRIAPSRYQSYARLYQELQNQKKSGGY